MSKSKLKSHCKGLLIAFWISMLVSTLVYAGTNYMTEFYNLSNKNAKIAFIKSLNEDELLAMGNQACIEDPTGEIAAWGVTFYGLKPIWDKNPPQAKKYLPLIKDENLHPVWRGNLLGVITSYLDSWSYKDIDRLVKYTFEYLKDSKRQIVFRRKCAGILDGLVYKKMLMIIESKELNTVEKEQRMNKLHFEVASMIKYLVNFLQEGTEKDEVLCGKIANVLDAFGSIYLSQKVAPSITYRRSQGFATAMKTVEDIGPVFKQLLQRKDTSVVLVSHIIKYLISLNMLEHIPRNLINDLKNDARFSGEKEQDSLLYWEQKIKEARKKEKKAGKRRTEK